MTATTLAILETGPVTTGDLAAHVREDHAADNAAALESSLAAALEYVERATGRTLNDRTRRRTIDAFPATSEPITLGEPASDIPAITYTDANGDPQTLTPPAYALLSLPTTGIINATTPWPTDATAIEITYTSPAPKTARQAVLMLAGYWYEQREAGADRTISKVPLSVDALIQQTRGVLIG